MKHNKTIKSALRIIALCAISAFLGINIYIWNAKSLTGNALPMPFGFGTAIVLSGSMEPALSVDDLIFVKAKDKYAVGDTVVFQNGGAIVVHRIISMTDQTVITKGDANNADDGEMNISHIKGCVIGTIPKVGVFVKFLKSPAVSLSLVALSIYLLERSFKKEKQQHNEELEQIKEEIRRLKGE